MVHGTKVLKIRSSQFAPRSIIISLDIEEYSFCYFAALKTHTLERAVAASQAFQPNSGPSVLVLVIIGQSLAALRNSPLSHKYNCETQNAKTGNRKTLQPKDLNRNGSGLLSVPGFIPRTFQYTEQDGFDLFMPWVYTQTYPRACLVDHLHRAHTSFNYRSSGPLLPEPEQHQIRNIHDRNNLSQTH